MLQLSYARPPKASMPSTPPDKVPGKRASSVELEGQPTCRPQSPSPDVGYEEHRRGQLERQLSTEASASSPSNPQQAAESVLHHVTKEPPKENQAEVGATGVDHVDSHVTCTCEVVVGRKNVEALIDTGASVTLARETAVNEAQVQETRSPRSLLKSATGHNINVTHEAKLQYEVGGQQIWHWTYVCPDLLHDVLIGYDFITDHGMIIDGEQQTIQCRNAEPVPVKKIQHARVLLIEPVTTQEEITGSEVDGKEGKKPVQTAEDLDTGVLTPGQRKALLEIVNEHANCFSWDGSLGSCTLIQHRIELTTDTPVRRPGYKAGYHDRELIEKEIREMLGKGIIQPSVSAYAAGVVLVPKKNGETRFCVDYRGLNAVTKPDNYPLSLTRSEIFDTMGEAKIFSCLDCQQGYWQVRMAEEDQHKTAFRCHLGLWEFRNMPFGLRNSPATYQRLMSHILSGYTGKFCHVFIDDIICFSTTFEEHLEHLRLIFARLEHANIKLKPSKCSFAKEQVKYLGHLLSPGEIRPDPSNVEKVRDLSTPTDVTGVRAFVGLASYYRSFVQDFSKRASPLTELTRKKVEFHWGQEQQAAFDDLKAALTSEPVLALPDFTKPFTFMTDGSSTGLGAVLAQTQPDGREQVIAYASKKTGPLERNYSACESECLALVWATQHFRDYILGRTTTVITDHWALQWLQTLRNASPRLQRWRMALQEYDLRISHKPGNQHRNADFLSRMHEHFKDDREDEEDLYPHAQQPQPNNEEGKPVTKLTCVVIPAGQGRRVLLETQKQDPDCQELIRSLGTETSGREWYRDHTFRLAPDGVLEEVTCDLTGAVVYKTVLPQAMIRQAIEDAHAGHLKTKKTLDKLRTTYFFKHMYATCHRYIQGCPTCQEKDRGPKYQAPLGIMPEPLGAWHTVAVDVLGPLPQTRTGKKYIIVITDHLTKYVLAIATRDQTAETTATVLMEKFLEYGLPERLISDNGSNFRSRLVKELCRLLKISQLFTTPYHPQFDGLCERYNRTLAAATYFTPPPYRYPPPLPAPPRYRYLCTCARAEISPHRASVSRKRLGRLCSNLACGLGVIN